MCKQKTVLSNGGNADSNVDVTAGKTVTVLWLFALGLGTRTLS